MGTRISAQKSARLFKYQKVYDRSLRKLASSCYRRAGVLSNGHMTSQLFTWRLDKELSQL